MNRIQPVHYQTNKVGSFEDYGCHAGREYLFLLIFFFFLRTGAGAQAQIRVSCRPQICGHVLTDDVAEQSPFWIFTGAKH